MRNRKHSKCFLCHKHLALCSCIKPFQAQSKPVGRIRAKKMVLDALKTLELEYKQRGSYFRGELERVRAEIQRIREGDSDA